MNRILLSLVVLLVLGVHACKTPARYSKNGDKITFLASSPRIAFYNVENLFDIVDDPNTPDEEFTPEGKNQWTKERYQKKLADLHQVIEAMAFPTFIGVCEIENATVLKDLIGTPALQKYNYNFAHQDSPDYRGIDVAFFYNQDNFQLLSTDAITINFPKEIVEDYTTRDILHVMGLYHQKDTLHFFINHWPSRRGGTKESEPKRIYVAEQLRAKVDAIFAKNQAANIIIMGDFNDETNNHSLTESLQVKAVDKYLEAGYLYNFFSKLDEENLGSYNYQGNWNMLDQIIVSTNLANPQHPLHVQHPKIIKKEFMIYKNSKYGEVPNRTYGGPNYYGGISDHFPVMVELTK